MTYCRENVLRAIRFESPAAIPMRFCINPACWHNYPHDQLLELVQSHLDIIPTWCRMPQDEYDPYTQAGKACIDGWGCVWKTTEDGIVGTVIEHPLKNWDRFPEYRPPDPACDSGRGPINWDQFAKKVQAAISEGSIADGWLRHGHTFLTLCDIRGYENLMLDMSDEEPRLWQLIEMVEHFNLELTRRTILGGVEMMGYPEDLGMQSGPMLSPAHFRKYIVPSFRRLFSPARDANCIIHMHSDGCIRELVDDILECGVDVLNLQDTVNGIDWIRSRLAGKICLEIDIDRQDITRFGTPAQIDDLIRQEVKALGSKRGGLMFIYGLYPGIPIENIRATMDAMQKYCAL